MRNGIRALEAMIKDGLLKEQARIEELEIKKSWTRSPSDEQNKRVGTDCRATGNTAGGGRVSLFV